MKADDRVRELWTSRVGEVATAKLIRCMHASVTQLAAVVILLSSVAFVVVVPKWIDLPAAFRGTVTVLMLILIVVAMAIPGERRSRLKKQACVDALNYLRATRHPTLARVPYAIMRNPKAFDKFVESMPPKRPL